MIPVPRELQGIPIHPEQMRLAIQGLEAELQMKRQHMEAHAEMIDAQAAYIADMALANGIKMTGSPNRYIAAIQAMGQREQENMRLICLKMEAEINIRRSMLEQAEQKTILT